MKFLFIKFINFYQMALSPLLGSNCRFYPTCSTYVKDCFENFPVRIALWYAMVRILKCHPFHKGGYDPVLTHNCCENKTKSVRC